ncbi:uncharacterized protein METZ01_LOCUS171005 [marine metagenome]|uniref:Uncharacterized protein n=1 Tax=marine metagenome TaxID=408172 RepID=A0A382BXB5_9ZZZZ
MKEQKLIFGSPDLSFQDKARENRVNGQARLICLPPIETSRPAVRFRSKVAFGDWTFDRAAGITGCGEGKVHLNAPWCSRIIGNAKWHSGS